MDLPIPILRGIYTDTKGDFRLSMPRNRVPVPRDQGISEGYLRPGDGVVEFGTGPGKGRGGYAWNGACYRVMGVNLVRINSDGSYTSLGNVGGVDLVSIDYGVDRLAIASNGNLFYWNGTTLTQVTDPDLGTVLDVLWVDGYYMTTDGEFLVVTDLDDPMSINPLKYGSAEADPDPIVGLLKIRNEVCALNRYTIEFFDNVGGTGFPFQRIEGAQIQRGALGTHCATIFMEQVAFLGSGKNESPAIWLAQNGSSEKISTSEIDKLLKTYTEDTLALCVVESRVDEDHRFLYVHLPDKTLLYDYVSSVAAKQPAWVVLDSGLLGGTYRARNFVWCYNKWLCEDPTTAKHGYLVDNVSSQYGDVVGWEFGIPILYNKSRGAIIDKIELICLTGRVEIGSDPDVFTSYSIDGLNWSQEKGRKCGRIGDYDKRLVWRKQGAMKHWRTQKFRGTSEAHISIASCLAQIRPLNV